VMRHLRRLDEDRRSDDRTDDECSGVGEAQGAVKLAGHAERVSVRERHCLARIRVSDRLARTNAIAPNICCGYRRSAR